MRSKNQNEWQPHLPSEPIVTDTDQIFDSEELANQQKQYHRLLHQDGKIEKIKETYESKESSEGQAPGKEYPTQELNNMMNMLNHQTSFDSQNQLHGEAYSNSVPRR